MTMARKMRAAFAVTAVGIAVTMAAGSGVAQAAPPGHPENCVSGYSDTRTGYATCWGGVGTFRAKVRCDKSWAPDYDRYSAWIYVSSTKQTGYAVCNSGDRAFNATFETRHILDS